MDESWKIAVQATLHCLTGCAVGEVLGMVIGTAVGLHNLGTVALSVVLAFIFGYAFTAWPLLKRGIKLVSVLKIALAADTVSILTMEVIDNSIMYFVPGAMDAGITTIFFWGTLTASLLIAFIVTVPVNRWLIARGKGHAVVHEHHQHH